MEALQRQLRGFAGPLAKVMLTVFVGLLAFELAQDLLWPDLPQWKSNAITIMYGVLLASVVGYFALRMHNVLYQRALEENEHFRKNEGELLRNKEWFRSLTEHGTDLITVIDPKGTILYDSPSVERILGYRPIDRQGKSGFDLVHPDDIPIAKKSIERAFQKLGSTHTVEMRVRGRDGRWHVLEATGRAMLDHEGKLRGVINSRDITERKQVQAALRQKEEYFRSLIENIQDIITVLNPDGTITYESPSVEHVLGYKPEELVGHNALELIHQEDRPRIMETLKKLFGNPGATAFEEFRFQSKDGSWRNLGSIGKSLADHSGNLVLVITSRDITARKQAEEKILALSKFPDENPRPILRVNSDDVLLYANKASQGLLKQWGCALGQKVPESWREDVALVLAEGKSREREEAVGERTLTLLLAPVRELGYVNFYGNDITERKRAEDKLRLQTTALEAAANGIVITDRDGTIVWVNPAFTTLTGYSAAEALGQTPRLLKSGFQDPAFYATLWSTITSGRSWHGEVVNKRKDGALYTEEQTITPVHDTQGKITHFIAIKRDITERKQMELQSRQLSRLAALGQLIGGIAHEIKNPLFILTGRVQMAREKLANQEYADLGSDLEILDETGRRMKTITDRFMTIAKSAPPQQERCSIQAAVNQVLEFLANELMKNKIRLATDFAPDLPEIWSDRHQLHELFLNLMLNTIQVMSRAHGNGTLTVSTKREANWIAVRIQDDGPGIPPEQRATMFEPFVGTGEQGTGPGLGLWVVRSTLMMLKGEIACESEVGKGTTFIVRLPVST